MKRLVLGILVTVAAVLLVYLPSLQAQGQGNNGDNGLAVGRPEWAAATHHDVSQPLRDIAGGPVRSTRPEFEVKNPNQTERGGTDTAVQSIVVAPFQAQFGAAFPGVGANGYAPPDTVGEAGPNHYIQWVNVQFAIFDKATGQMIGQPKPGNALWSGFGGDCESRNDGDPIIQYDQLADRWIFTQFAVANRNYMQCVAVSTSGDPTGSYYRYSFSYNDFPDYPKLTIWPDAYYITFNMFKNGRTFSGARACAYERAAMMAGAPARQVCAQLPQYASLLSADVDGPAPPAGTPNYLLSRGSNALYLFQFKVNWANPSQSTFSNATTIPVTGFSIACGGGACIPQKGTSTKLDSLGDRLMYRLAYRNLGAAGERLVVNHSVTSGSVTGIRWYELDVTGVGRVAGANPSVRQQSTYAPSGGLYRWMGSIAMDKNGNIAMGYSTSNSTNNPAIEWAGRLSSDPLNTMSSPAVLWAGNGSQTGSLSRWGDYSTISLDPSDDCTFWFTSETIPTNGAFNWATQFGSFKFAGCGAMPAPAATHPAARPQSR